MEQFNMRRVAPLLLVALVFCLLPFVISKSVLPEATRIVVLAGTAMSLNLLVGATGLISMGQGLFFGLGAYVVALGTIRFGMSYGSAAMLALAICLPLSLVVALISLRAKHLFFGLRPVGAEAVGEEGARLKPFALVDEGPELGGEHNGSGHR